jgi:flagellar biosynthesis protein FlhF
MQIKEFEAFTLKECLQQVRSALGPEAVILETRKCRKGGFLGWGARDAVCIVAATGVTVQSDLPNGHQSRAAREETPAATTGNAREAGRASGSAATTATAQNGKQSASPGKTASAAAATASQAAAVTAARAAFARSASAETSSSRIASSKPRAAQTDKTPASVAANRAADKVGTTARAESAVATATKPRPASAPALRGESETLVELERNLREIRDSIAALQREQKESQERTVTAVVSAVAPVMTNRAVAAEPQESAPIRFPELHHRLIEVGVSEALAAELLDSLPDFSAWSPQAQLPLAEAALRDMIAHRIASAGPITLTPGQLKAVALIGPTGVGKTTTIAKLAAHFALVEHKRVALLTVDTYRIAAVEQLKNYGQIIDIPVGVAYNQAEVLPVVEQFADYDLLLIDTAGRSQKNRLQVGELKTLLEAVNCETHLVLSAPIKEDDMLESVQRFSAARVDRLLFSKLDETGTYGTLLNVADQSGIPLSYLTTGQKVPEDIEVAEGSKLASLLLNAGPA